MSEKKNENLHKAKETRYDEFYTQLSDIENEVKHYKEHFKDKIVFCNCDDPFESNFFKYFIMNFNQLGLEKLIATGYATSSIVGTQLPLFEEINGRKVTLKAYKIEITEVKDVNGDGRIDLNDVKYLLERKEGVKALKGDGDFRSEESLKLLKEADIVVTNPPFSLFRDYIAQLMEYHKKFLIIGNKNAISCKEIFPLIKNDEIWLGFTVPKDFILPGGEISHKQNGLTRWYTNLDIQKRHEDLILYRKYNPQDYPEYDNYKAININQVADIPYDYDGIMGVPITFIDKYNPEQFEIIASDYQIKEGGYSDIIKHHWQGKLDRGYINGERIYARILIRRKK